MKIFVYPYSPTTIGFDPDFDGYVITTANAFERYLKLGFLKEKIEIAESIDFKHVFRIVQDLVEKFRILMKFLRSRKMILNGSM